MGWGLAGLGNAVMPRWGHGYCAMSVPERKEGLPFLDARIQTLFPPPIFFTHRLLRPTVKSANILLDESLNPQLADLGLCAILPSDADFIAMGLAGSHGEDLALRVLFFASLASLPCPTALPAVI